MLYERQAAVDDALFLAANMRQADKDECMASAGLNPTQVLETAYEHSTILRAVVLGPPKGNHNVVALYGTVPYDTSIGLASVWMLGTDQLVQGGMTFARRCTEYIDWMHSYYPALFNFVDARNTLHLRWLKWAGFNFIQRHETFGYEKRPFYEFFRMQW